MPRRISGCERFVVVALLLLAFALRTVALTRVPPGLHNDEVIDIKLTESVVGGRLAVFFPEDIGSEVLYFYFAAPFMRVLGSTVFAMRLPAVFLSTVSMCIIWALARRLLGPVVALAALAGFAITFWTVAFGRIVLHVVMEVPLAALAAYCFWRASSYASAACSRRRWRAPVLWACSGLGLGLAINAYTAARILPAILVAFGVYVLLVRRSDWRRWWGGIGIALAVTGIVVLPLFLYLVRNPGADQLDFYDIDRPLVELRKGNLVPAIETSLRTLGMFASVGDPLPYYDVPGRPVFEPVGALLLAVGLLIALWRAASPLRRLGSRFQAEGIPAHPKSPRQDQDCAQPSQAYVYAFLLLWFFLSLVPGMLSQPAPNYTRTLGVQVVLFAIPGIAIAALLEWRNRALQKKLRFWTCAALALLFVGNLAWTVRDYFFVWPSVDVVRFWHQSGLKAVADRLQVDADTSPVAICVPDRLIDERDPWWKPAWLHCRYLLHRPDLSLRYYNCADAIVFIEGPARYAFPDVADVEALDQYPVYSQILAAASPANLELAFLPDQLGVIVRSDRTTTQRRIQAALDQRLEAAADAPVAWTPEAGGADQPALVPINFQDAVEFLGYTLSASSSTASLRPGDSFDLATYWHVTRGLPPQFLQFTHVLNADGAVVAQQDRLALTSASLRPGDVFVQIHHLTLPSDLPKGEYPLAIGLYTPSDGARLRITQAGQPRGDQLWLRAIVVGEATP